LKREKKVRNIVELIGCLCTGVFGCEKKVRRERWVRESMRREK